MRCLPPATCHLLKFISDTFEQHKQKLIDKGQEKYIDLVQAYTKENVFYLPEESRWSFVQQNAKQEDIALKIDTALSTIEKTNKALQGALPDNYFSRLGLDVSKLSALIDSIIMSRESCAIRIEIRSNRSIIRLMVTACSFNLGW